MARLLKRWRRKREQGKRRRRRRRRVKKRRRRLRLVIVCRKRRDVFCETRGVVGSTGQGRVSWYRTHIIVFPHAQFMGAA